MAPPDRGIPLSNKQEQSIDTRNLDGFQGPYIE